MWKHKVGHWYKPRRVKGPKWNLVELHILVFLSMKQIHDSLQIEYDLIDSWLTIRGLCQLAKYSVDIQFIK